MSIQDKNTAKWIAGIVGFAVVLVVVIPMMKA